MQAGDDRLPNRPDFVIVWDTAVVSPGDYADLVAALGDLVRASGGLGVERVRSATFGVAVAGAGRSPG